MLLEENVILAGKLVDADVVSLGHEGEAFSAVASTFSIVVSVVDASVAVKAV